MESELLPIPCMTRPEPAYLELSVGDDDIIEDADEDEATRVARDLFDPNVAWFDEKTARIDFDQLVLSPEAKLIADKGLSGKIGGGGFDLLDDSVEGVSNGALDFTVKMRSNDITLLTLEPARR